jgi:hypothetical protein
VITELFVGSKLDFGKADISLNSNVDDSVFISDNLVANFLGDPCELESLGFTCFAPRSVKSVTRKISVSIRSDGISNQA